MRTPLRVGVVLVCVCVGFYAVGSFLWLWLNAAFAETSVSTVWRELGGFKGYFHLVSDLQLAASPDAFMAEQAASRLLTQHQCSKEDAMISFLKVEKRPNVQRWVLQALAACNSRKAIPEFREALRSDNLMIAAVGAESLGMVKADEAIPDLESMIRRRGYDQAAGQAAYALAKMGEREFSYEWAIAALSSAPPARDRDSRDFYKRYHAMHVLAEIGTAKDVPLLEKNRQQIGSKVEFDAVLAKINNRGPR